MSNERSKDIRAFGDDSDDYVVVDPRHIILGLPDGATVSAVLPDRDLRASHRRVPVRPGFRDDRRDH